MQALLDALRDPEVPVVVNASMSLGFFIGRESCKRLGLRGRGRPRRSRGPQR